jgi:hypothetical protein
MKNLFYAVCPIPAICELVSMASPNDFNAGGGPAILFQLGLLALVILLCPLFTCLGLTLIASSKSKLGPCIVTGIAALSGLGF